MLQTANSHRSKLKNVLSGVQYSAKDNVREHKPDFRGGKKNPKTNKKPPNNFSNMTVINLPAVLHKL